MTQSNLPKQQNSPIISILLWLLSATYIYILLLSPQDQLLPNGPIWAVQPETIKEVIEVSINFFFILPIFNVIGIKYMEAPIVHPWLESLFNFAEAWIFMFLPLLLVDRRGGELPKILIWSMAMFLTNTFLLPYMAWRSTATELPIEEQMSKGLLAKIFGVVGLIIGSIAIVWGIFARPEFGDIPTRGKFFIQNFQSDRLTIAFCVDVILFAIFQAVLIGNIEPPESGKRWLRFLPFWGLAIWLIL
ncbi:MAG: hypothetical protein O4861_13025 [Trichodesmium sp. St16_bin4-tuft]|nr:hypothetical protein [Trichodesmium sp. St5_bin8]MDE5091784.1 hypothetical protein [Trichodesmium sp. St18_bin3_1_1]MDE5099201.1 hypothetical protein [Trichodesmium sp. St16_bin4-tuft]MDE5103863.1 hypothetical protein [Trichodesmium sp. St19_bin2]